MLVADGRDSQQARGQATVALVLAAAAPAVARAGESAAGGAVTCDFGVSTNGPLDQVVPLLEPHPLSAPGSSAPAGSGGQTSPSGR